MSAGIGRQNIIILFWKYEGCTVSFLGIQNGNQTLILDSYRPFIANALQGHDCLTTKAISAAAVGQAVVEGAAAGAARPTAALPGERTATGRMLDTKEGMGTGSAIKTPGTPGTAATAVEDFRGEVEATADTGLDTASNTAGSLATGAAAAEWLK
jgi:hypothetical protein